MQAVCVGLGEAVALGDGEWDETMVVALGDAVFEVDGFTLELGGGLEISSATIGLAGLLNDQRSHALKKAAMQKVKEQTQKSFRRE